MGGSAHGMASNVMIWTDIWYDKAEGESAMPTPGMSLIELELEEDKVDLPAIGRYIASKCAKLSSVDPFEPMDMQCWVDKTVPQADLEQLDPMLLPDERVQMGFTCGRDALILTTHRAIKI